MRVVKKKQDRRRGRPFEDLRDKSPIAKGLRFVPRRHLMVPSGGKAQSKRGVVRDCRPSEGVTSIKRVVRSAEARPEGRRERQQKGECEAFARVAQVG